eukprot:UN25873
MENLIKLNVYLKDNDKQKFQDMNKAYTKYFAKLKITALPARITVGCGALALGASVEIDALCQVF